MQSTQDKYTDSSHLYIYRQLKAGKKNKYPRDIYANAEKSRTFAIEKGDREFCKLKNKENHIKIYQNGTKLYQWTLEQGNQRK